MEVVNRNGQPAFVSKTALTSSPGSFALQTGPDVNMKSETVIGVATVNEEGSLRPLATMKAPFNTTIDVSPSSTLYISAKSGSVGGCIDATVESKHAVAIDFTCKPGMYGAIVTHQIDGSFKVEYASQADYNKAIFTAQQAPAADPRDAEIARLKEQVEQLQALLNGAKLSTATSSLPTPTINVSKPKAAVTTSEAPVAFPSVDPYPGKQATTWYKATLPFRNNPGQSRRKEIRDRMTSLMQHLGYNYEGATIDNALLALFSHNAGSYGNWHSVQKASEDWKEAFNSLSRSLRGFTAIAEDLAVERCQESRGLWRARGETESRVKEVTTGINGISVANGVNGARQSPSPASSKPLTNGSNNIVNGIDGRHHDRAHSKTTAKPVTNGINGVHKDHSRASSRSASPVSPVWTNGMGNGAHGNAHGRKVSKPLTNAVHIAPNGAISNGINGTTMNGSTKKYDYPRAEETAIEAAKRRARAVLEAEGLAELASGWKVSGR